MHNHHHTELNIDIKPQIDYPCRWSYRIIGLHKEHVIEAINRVFEGKEVDISPIEHHSSHNKYVAINCSTIVDTDEERVRFFDGLVAQYGIVMVI